MIQIYIFADSYKQFNEAIKEYQKRLGRQVSVTKLKPVKKWTPAQIIASETDIITAKLAGQNAYKIVLSPGGKSLNTFEFHKLIEDNKHIYPDTIFCIGWAYGLDYKQLSPHLHLQISLSGFILPHGLALTIILEQIYRAGMIEKWSDYHK